MGRGWGWGDRYLAHHLALDDDGHFPLDDEDATVEAVMTFPGEMIGGAGEIDPQAAGDWPLLGVGLGSGEDSRHRRTYGQ
jgi:hypothetical protein